MSRLIELLFGCRHRRTSRVFTNKGCRLHWIVCFDCGKRLRYDWEGLGRIA